jgi:hypothetical protein
MQGMTAMIDGDALIHALPIWMPFGAVPPTQSEESNPKHACMLRLAHIWAADGPTVVALEGATVVPPMPGTSIETEKAAPANWLTQAWLFREHTATAEEHALALSNDVAM